ncbi:MAG: chorismate mutase [Gammaproteobacteria bacterium]
MADLGKFRSELNEIDEQIVALLGRRFTIIRKVADYKKANQVPMMQPGRVEEVKDRCAALAAAHDVNPDLVRKLYGLIIDDACRVEDEIIDEP